MSEFTTNNGAAVVINPAPWECAVNLKNVFMKNLAEASLSMDNFSKDADAMPLIQAVMKLDSNPEFNHVIWPCLVRCTRNGEKITAQTFEDVAARADYYAIIVACVKENITPFFAGLISGLPSLLALLPKGESQK